MFCQLGGVLIGPSGVLLLQRAGHLRVDQEANRHERQSVVMAALIAAVSVSRASANKGVTHARATRRALVPIVGESGRSGPGHGVSMR